MKRNIAKTLQGILVILMLFTLVLPVNAKENNELNETSDIPQAQLNSYHVVITDQFNDPVVNVKITLISSNAQEVYTATSNRLGIATFGEISGTFRLMVTSMPSNYTLVSEEPIYVNIDPTQNVGYDLKLLTTNIGSTSITVYDDYGNVVPNVKLSILHQDNTTTFESTSSNLGIVSFNNIKVGNYRIVHTTLPEGYDVNYPIETPVVVYLNDNTLTSIIINKLPTSTVPGTVLVKITKYTPTEYVGFPNVQINLRNLYNSTQYNLTTGDNGMVNFDSVLPGAYEVNVLNLPSEYVPLGAIEKIIVYPEQQAYAEANAVRSTAMSGSLFVYVKDQINGIGEVIQNLTLKITNPTTGLTKQVKSNSDGLVEFIDLPIGTYNLEVIDQLTGLSFNTQTIQNNEIKGDTITNQFIWYDASLTSISSKVVDQNRVPISNVEVYLLNPVTNIKSVLKTDAFGYVVFENIAVGTYEMGLVKIPDGYLGPKSTKVTLEKTEGWNLGHVYHLTEDGGSVILPVSIKMLKLPNKLDYVKDEPLDLTGAQLEVTFNDNSKQIIPLTHEMVSGYNPDFSVYGEKVLTVMYGNYSTTFSIFQNRFKDVKHNYWAADAVNIMAEFGVINGYTDGNFKPGANVTRAEAIVMIIRFLDYFEGFELDPTINSTFSDLPNTNWAKAHIMTAVNYGILSGYPDGTFKPNNPITRAELSKMIFGAFMMEVVGQYSNSYPDISGNHWAYDIIMSMSEYEILKGFNDGYFYPNKTTTRAELATILYRLGQ